MPKKKLNMINKCLKLSLKFFIFQNIVLPLQSEFSGDSIYFINFLTVYNAYYTAVSKKRKRDINVQVEISGIGFLPSASWGVHKSLYYYTKEAKLGSS